MLNGREKNQMEAGVELINMLISIYEWKKKLKINNNKIK